MKQLHPHPVVEAFRTIKYKVQLFGQRIARVVSGARVLWKGYDSNSEEILYLARWQMKRLLPYTKDSYYSNAESDTRRLITCLDLLDRILDDKRPEPSEETQAALDTDWIRLEPDERGLREFKRECTHRQRVLITNHAINQMHREKLELALLFKILHSHLYKWGN